MLMKVGMPVLLTAVIAYFGGWTWALFPSGFCLYQFVQMKMGQTLILCGVTNITLPSVTRSLTTARYRKDHEGRRRGDGRSSRLLQVCPENTCRQARCQRECLVRGYVRRQDSLGDDPSKSVRDQQPQCAVLAVHKPTR